MKIHNILLVEDNKEDSILMMEALKDSFKQIKIEHVTNGAEALSYLRQEEAYKDAPRPDLIFLDIKMPWCNGHDLLKQVKTDPHLSRIPIVVLTTSASPDDVNGAYREGANCYIQKPVSFEKFKQVVSVIHDFWFGIVKLPD